MALMQLSSVVTVFAVLCFLAAAGFAALWISLRKRTALERRAAEEQAQKDGEFLRRLQRRAELLHRLVDGIDDGLFIIAADTRVLFVNLGAQGFFPPVTEPVGRKLIECVPDRRIVELVERSLRSGQREAQEIPVTKLRAHGTAKERIYDVLAVPLQSDAIHAAEGELLLILRDETQKHMLEKIRKDFVANASHELRTPLSIIIGYLENLIDGDITEEEDVHRAFTVMKKHGDRLAQIVEDLLVISRMESGLEETVRMEEFDLHDCADDVVHRLSPVIGAKGANVHVDVKPGTVTKMRGDRFYWDQILFNLVQNALKENQGQGLDVQIAIEDEEGRLKVDIRDNGVGIPAADLPFVFKRFYRVVRPEGREIKGTGLGLSIVRRAVEAHKGSIELSSRPGIETVFTIRVPRGG